MNDLDRLRISLRHISSRNWQWPLVPKALEQEIISLKRALGEGGGVAPTRDRMKEAVSNFWRDGQLAGLAAARLTCFGAIERFVPQRPPLIEDAAAFPLLLDRVDEYSLDARPFRRCYRGLIYCYFNFDPDGTGVPEACAKNWVRLQEYLDARYDSIRVNGLEPDWVSALAEHRNLLTKEPVRPYAAAALKGDTDDFVRACHAIEIAETSWLVRRLILAQVLVATEQPDERFKPHVSPLLGVLEQHPVVQHVGLAQLVNRYAASLAREEDRTLRDAAIQAWGNPLLQRNRPRWGRVTDEARRMVANWLKLGLIQGFFEVLSEDRATDRRRVDFWKRYHDQIDGMYFALGSNARDSRDADIQALRKQMGDLKLTLARGGASGNNAFIMLLGEYVVVEFGVTGNACFIFDRANLPFVLRGTVTGDTSGLKHPSHKNRIRHADTSWGSWEREVERVLSGLGVHPDTVADTKKKTRRGASLGREEPSSRDAFSGEALRNLGHRHGFEIEDLTWKGGRLWVVGAAARGLVATQLVSWGFRWAERKNAWYRGSWD